MRLPRPQGPLSHRVIQLLASPVESRGGAEVDVRSGTRSVFEDLDFQLALWMLYEQSYRGFADAYDHEWDPAAVALRRTLDSAFEDEIRGVVAAAVHDAGAAAPTFEGQLAHLLAHAPGPSVARFVQRGATREQVLEFLRHRSLYHLKESDPHSFVVGRVEGRVKVALAELQYDEYGAGRPEGLHSQLYANALGAADLDPSYGAYVDETPAATIAVNNLMSLFCLNGRLKGAAIGHLVAFEATSSVPCRQLAAGILRVGLPTMTAAYFDEHIEADAVHEQIAIHDIGAAFLTAHPELCEDVLLGAAACLHLDAVVATDMMDRWGVHSAGIAS